MSGGDEPTQLVGRYQLLEKLAVGGMAELYRARMTGAKGFEKYVVLKKILPNLAADEEFVTMFVDEAKLTALLVHPKIVQVHELGLSKDELFIAMEYVDGIDTLMMLRDFARRGAKIPAVVAVHIIQEVLDALDYAHHATDEMGKPLGIVHRDITPGNIMVSRRGDIKLTDFGIARAAVNQNKTTAGTLKGKYGYMSPEQVLSGNLDGRSDVFACAVVLSEMLMGRRLFLAQSELDVLLMVRDVKLDRLNQFGDSIDPGLMAIIRTALARDVGDRFQSAREFREALLDWAFQAKRRVGSSELAAIVMDVRERQPRPASTSMPPPPPPPKKKAAPVEDPDESTVASEPASLPDAVEPPPPPGYTADEELDGPTVMGTSGAWAEQMTPTAQVAVDEMNEDPDNPSTMAISAENLGDLLAQGAAEEDPQTMSLSPERLTALLGSTPAPPSGSPHVVREDTAPVEDGGADALEEGTRAFDAAQLEGLLDASSEPELQESTRAVDQDALRAFLDSGALPEEAPADNEDTHDDVFASDEVEDEETAEDTGLGMDLLHQASSPAFDLGGPALHNDDDDDSDLGLGTTSGKSAAEFMLEADEPPTMGTEAIDRPPDIPVGAPVRPEPPRKAAPVSAQPAPARAPGTPPSGSPRDCGEADAVPECPDRDPDAHGSFETVAPMHVIYRLAAAGATGLLHVACGTISKSLYFDAGHVQLVHSNVGGEDLSTFLPAKQLISAGELAMAMAVLPRFDNQLPATILALELMDEVALDDALREQLADKLLDICTWARGEYRWFAGERHASATEGARNGHDVWATLGQASLQLPAEYVAAWARPHLGKVLVTHKNPNLTVDSFSLGARSQDLLRLIDGTRTLRELMELFPHERMWIDAARAIHLFVQTGLLQLDARS